MEGDKRKIIISIIDSGVGIKREEMPKLFNEYQMMESNRKDNPNGK